MIPLTEGQNRHLRVCFAGLVREAERMADEFQTRGYEAAALAAQLRALSAETRALADRLGISVQTDPPDPRRRLQAWASSWWATVLDCGPRALRGWGQVHPEAAALLEPAVEDLADRLMRVQRAAAYLEVTPTDE